MGNMSMKILKCASCGYAAKSILWIQLHISGYGDNPSVIGRAFDEEEKSINHLGALDICACPKCNTIRIVR